MGTRHPSCTTAALTLRATDRVADLTNAGNDALTSASTRRKWHADVNVALKKSKHHPNKPAAIHASGSQGFPRRSSSTFSTATFCHRLEAEELSWGALATRSRGSFAAIKTSSWQSLPRKRPL